MSRGRVAWWLSIALMLVAASCAADDPLTRPPSSTRPPLDSPPDPGLPPVSDGLSDDVRDRVIESTVWISGLACGRGTEGSGFAVASDLVATAAHVIIGVEEVEVTMIDGRTLVGVPVVWDTTLDLAVLRVEGAALRPLTLGTASDGTTGALMGWERDPRPDPTPFRIDRPITVRITEVAGTAKVERPSWLLAAKVEAGDSGAALVDNEGVVVGITFATTRREAGVGYAVRATQLAEILEGDLSERAKVAGCR